MDPEALSLKSREDFDDPQKQILLANHYEAELHNPAMSDLFGRLLWLHHQVQEALLKGSWDERGRDRTPDLREVHALLEQIITIPSTMEQQKAFYEENYLGVDTGLDTS